MVTPTNGTISFMGLQTGRPYTYNIYISDVAAAKVTWSTTGQAVAGDDNFILVPENMVITDIAITTGPTVIFNLVPYVNDTPIGQIIKLGSVIDTVQTRSFPRLGFTGGRKLTFKQA